MPIHANWLSSIEIITNFRLFLSREKREKRENNILSSGDVGGHWVCVCLCVEGGGGCLLTPYIVL